jgi:hypothetical protein
MEEVVTYDPEDIDTYPSVCSDPESVKARFGWTGGERFTHRRIDEWLRGIERHRPITHTIAHGNDSDSDS